MANWDALTQDEMNKIAELYKKGLSYKEITAETGRSRASIGRVVADFNLARCSSGSKEKMLELRSKGLSNFQIAKELGCSYQNVYRTIGKQPDGNRAEYGSIVSHVTGKSYVDQTLEKPKPAAPKPKAILLEESVFRFKGKDFSYRVDTKGHVRIIIPSGSYLDISDPKALFSFMNELADIGEFLLKMPQFSDVRRAPL